MVFFNGLNQWFKPFGLNQPTLKKIVTTRFLDERILIDTNNAHEIYVQILY